MQAVLRFKQALVQAGFGASRLLCKQSLGSSRLWCKQAPESILGAGVAVAHFGC